MGFVRMVRSGGLHRSSKAFCFIPDAENVESFEALTKDDNYASSLSAATALDEVVASSTKNSSDGMDFFKVKPFEVAGRTMLSTVNCYSIPALAKRFHDGVSEPEEPPSAQLLHHHPAFGTNGGIIFPAKHRQPSL